MTDNDPAIRLKRDGGKHILPDDFFDIAFYRYFPVASIIYIAALIGVAFREADNAAGLVPGLLQNSHAYHTALYIVLWTSIPALFWIVLRSSMRYAAYAAHWYKGVSGLMILTLLINFVLFPEWEVGGDLRIFFVVTIPVLVIQYVLFIGDKLPVGVAWPMTVTGMVLMIYGIFIV